MHFLQSRVFQFATWTGTVVGLNSVYVNTFRMSRKETSLAWVREAGADGLVDEKQSRPLVPAVRVALQDALLVQHVRSQLEEVAKEAGAAGTALQIRNLDD